LAYDPLAAPTVVRRARGSTTHHPLGHADRKNPSPRVLALAATPGHAGLRGLVGARRKGLVMRLPRRRDDHAWSQQHLSHYVEGDLTRRARLRLELHAADCPDCSGGIRAIRALVRLAGRLPKDARAPSGIFNRVRADAHATGRLPKNGAGQCNS
jgi:hypothetical protein